MSKFLYKCGWESAHFCKNCNNLLTERQIAVTYFIICPSCGCDNNFGIMPHKTRVRRWVVTKRTLMGWIKKQPKRHKGYWEYKDESKEVKPTFPPNEIITEGEIL